MTALLREVIGDVLRRARTEQGRTLREVSDTARVSLGYLSEVERGRKEASERTAQRHLRRPGRPAVARCCPTPARRWPQEELAALARAPAQPASTPRRRSSSRRSSRWRWPGSPPRPLEITAQGCGDLRGTDKLAVEQSGTVRRHEGGMNPWPIRSSRRGSYLMALFSSKVDEYADPKVQIQQAIEDAQRQHQALTQQAAAGDRQPAPAGDAAQPAARRDREAAGQRPPGADAGRSGHRRRATPPRPPSTSNAAEAFAAQLVTAEQSVEDLKGLHDQALQAAGPGQEGRRAERDDAAAEDRRAH